MKAILNWVKSNPIIVVCAVAFLFSVGWIFAINSAGGDFTTSMKNGNNLITELKSIMSQRVQIPPEKPDGLPRFPTITVNQHAIDDLRAVYEKMNDEYQKIYKFANQHNQAGHIEMLDSIFPDPHADPSRPFEAKARYRKSFEELVEPYSASAGYPQINAKPPLTTAEMNQALKEVERDYLNNFLPPKLSVSELTPHEQAKLTIDQEKKQIAVLIQHAKSTHIYAQTDPTQPGYPFEVQSWSSYQRPTPPTNIEIWDGQMSLWIQQDICKAIQLANKVESPGSNVMNAPVKHLMGIVIDPKYIGLSKDDTLGVDRRIPDDFSVSMSGRYCNPLYDVRHAMLTVIMDSQRMPEFFNALSQVNFMTVIGVKVTDIDEYDALRAGAVYGPTDCVKVEMKIETIWLREWTTKMMPKEKKLDLGLPLERAPRTPATPTTPAR